MIFYAVYGNLPSKSQLADWEFAVSQHSAVPQGILVCFSQYTLYYEAYTLFTLDYFVARYYTIYTRLR